MAEELEGAGGTPAFALLELALARIQPAAFLIDEDGTVRFVNDEACRSLGYAADELRGRQAWWIDPSLSAEAWRRHWDRMSREGTRTFESRQRAHDGRLIPVQITTSYFEHEDRGYQLAMARDLTLRQRLQRDRQVSLHFVTSLDRVNRAIQASSDLDGMMGDVLDLLLEILECDRAFLVHPCDPASPSWTAPMERVRPGYPVALNLGIPIPTDAEVAESFRILLDADDPVTFGPGNSFPLPTDVSERFSTRSFMSVAIRPRSGRPWQLGVHQCCRERVWTDQDEQLLQEVGRRLADGLTMLLTLRDLQRSERRFRRIVDTANEGIWALDADDRMAFVNARLCQLLGYPAQEMLGRSTHDFSFAEDLPALAGRSDSCHTGRAQRYERRFRHRDGHEVWTITSVTPTLDEQGSYRGAFAMVTDISEQKRAEEHAQGLNEQLEQRVRDRTHDLEASNLERDRAFRELQGAHARILQQEKMASIGQLAAGIAHEINTPTQFVGDNLNFLTEACAQVVRAVESCRSVGPALPESDLDFLVEEIPRAVQDCVTGVQRIARIVGAMKDFAHRSGGQREPVDLTRLIRSTVEMSRHEWKLLAEVELDLDPGASGVPGMRDELGQVLLNLLVNAAHAIQDADRPTGTGRIGISTSRSGTWIEVRVQDNGCGIPPDVQRRIFEPFFTTKAVGRGSGQGLAIAYDTVVNGHGGQIAVDSTPGGGSTFLLRIPSGEAELGADGTDGTDGTDDENDTDSAA
jgi:PAS domain S-box-containing protein